MNLNDLETPPPGLDPSPRTPQQMAAAKLARQQAETETAPVARQSIPQTIVGAVGVLAVAGVLALAVFQHGAPPAPRPLITPEPTFVTGRQAAQDGSGTTEAPKPAQASVPATIDAYAAPGGVVLGDFDPTSERLAFIGHYAGGWVQIRRPDGSQIWLRRADMQLDATDLAAIASTPDLTPPPAAAEPQTGQGMTLAQPPAPAADPAPAEQPIIDAPLPAETGAKAADDRAAHHAAAVARLQLPPPARDGAIAPASERGSK